MNVGESRQFNYTGGIQTFTVPHTGVYKLEVWGSAGNQVSSSGYGGYSMGFKRLKKGTILYICCGAQTYNGGGSGGGANSYGNHHGGGATHIALVSGTLASIGKETFDQQGLIVAGGGGGHGHGSEGSGGGLSGGNSPVASGGTQTSGYAFGQGGPGGFASYWGCGGGGGGYYGGYGGSGSVNNTGYSGAGGSGWIGGVTSYKNNAATTSNGVNGGDGYAKITLIQKSTVKIGDTDCIVYLGSTEIDSIYHGGTEL